MFFCKILSFWGLERYYISVCEYRTSENPRCFFAFFLHFLTFLAPQMLLYKHFRPLKFQNRLQPWVPCFKGVWGLSKFVFCPKMTKIGQKSSIWASHIRFTASKTLLYKHFLRTKGAKSSRFLAHFGSVMSGWHWWECYQNCMNFFSCATSTECRKGRTLISPHVRGDLW